MSTINLPKVRACSDITLRVGLEDNGVALDWNSLSDIKALIYSDAQKAIAGRCSVEIDSEDSTILVCTYVATKPQYLGINSIVIRCKYMGREKTYDKQAVDIVARTSEATGVTTVDDPVVDVDINVEDVSTSLLDNAIAAAIKAAEDAEEAAHLVPLQVLEDCRQATIEAGAARGRANEAAEAALAAGAHSVPIIIEGTGTWGRWDESLGRYVDTGLPSRGIQGEKGDKGDTGETGPQGPKGDTGVSADYPIAIHNGLDSDATDEALAAAQGKVLDGKVSQLGQELLNATTIDGAELTRVNRFQGFKTTFVAGNLLASSETTDVILFNVGANKKFKVTGTCSITTPVCGLVSGSGTGHFEPTTKLFDSNGGAFSFIAVTTSTQGYVAITVDKETTYHCYLEDDIEDKTVKNERDIVSVANELNAKIIDETSVNVGTLSYVNKLQGFKTTFTPGNLLATSDTTDVIIFNVGVGKKFKVTGTCSITTPVCGLVSGSSAGHYEPTTKLFDSTGGAYSFIAETTATQGYVAITVDKNTDYSCTILGSLKEIIEEQDVRCRVDILNNDSEITILNKLLKAFDTGNCDVYWEPGVYTFSEVYIYMRDTLEWEWTMELPIGNNCRYYFQGATIISNAPQEEYSDSRNIFGCKAGRGDKMNYELYDGVLVNNGGTYCVHDECAYGTIPYIHKYYNMRMYYNVGATTNPSISKCIGGGCGKSGIIIMQDCLFRTDNTQVDISWHGLTGDVNGITFSIFINACTFTKAPIVNGLKAADELYVKYSNCEQGQAPYFDTTPTNEIITFNNSTRS